MQSPGTGNKPDDCGHTNESVGDLVAWVSGTMGAAVVGIEAVVVFGVDLEVEIGDTTHPD